MSQVYGLHDPYEIEVIYRGQSLKGILTSAQLDTGIRDAYATLQLSIYVSAEDYQKSGLAKKRNLSEDRKLLTE